jgi:hypothetical protein
VQSGGNLPYLAAMVDYAMFAGEIWDKLFAPSNNSTAEMDQVIIDAKLAHWIDTAAPCFVYEYRQDIQSEVERRQSTLVQTVSSFPRHILGFDDTEYE